MESRGAVEEDIRFKVQGGKIVTRIDRPPREVTRKFTEIPTSIISDCLDRFNVMDAAIKPLGPRRRFAGPAVTVEELEAGNLMSHLALQYIEPGDVLVIDGKGITSRACWGGLQTFACVRKGGVAVIIDGAVRDLDDIIKYDIPVYCRAVTPAGPHKGWGGRINLPISCGGMVVNPGDLVVGDLDGIVVVPRAQVEITATKASSKMALENEWFKQVEGGGATADFLGFAELVQKYQIEIV